MFTLLTTVQGHPSLNPTLTHQVNDYRNEVEYVCTFDNLPRTPISKP